MKAESPYLHRHRIHPLSIMASDELRDLDQSNRSLVARATPHFQMLNRGIGFLVRSALTIHSRRLKRSRWAMADLHAGQRSGNGIRFTWASACAFCRECLSMVRASLLAFTRHGGKDAGQIRKEMRKAQLAKVAESELAQRGPDPAIRGFRQ
jgi:hypothetical protein